ncbi:MAG TPA: hypothetical protein VK141_04175 [Nitrosomonas sp.]|nr:hypothetical protein [Nitrosomonas sp.]
MAKATIKLNNGTLVTIEGTVKEVEELLQFYSGNAGIEMPQISKNSTKTKIEQNTLQESASEEPSFDMMAIINLVKTCDEAEAIEKQILDRTSEVNRVLLPLYVIHEYLKNAFGLSTTEVANITTELGIRVSRQNALRAVKFSGARYVIGDKPRKQGSATRYKLNRRGVQYMKSVIAGSPNEEQS